MKMHLEKFFGKYNIASLTGSEWKSKRAAIIKALHGRKVLENNEDRWTDEWEKGITKDSDVPAKWTNSGRVKGDGKTRKFCGWAKEGIERFNDLMIIGKKDRKKKTC